MNYKKQYNALINKAIDRNLIKLKKTDPNYIYLETHHIIPKCMNGTNEDSNLVNLTAKEHFIAHHLLSRIYGGKLWYAFHVFCYMKRNKKYKVTTSNYSELKNNYKFSKEARLKINKIQQTQEYKNKMCIACTGEKNGFYGKTHSDESKIKMSGERQKSKKRHTAYNIKTKECTNISCEVYHVDPNWISCSSKQYKKIKENKNET